MQGLSRDIIFQIINILIALGVSFVTIANPEKPTSLVILGVIFIVVIISSIYFWIRNTFDNWDKRISNHTERIKKIESELNYLNKFHEVDKRLVILEKGMKK